MNGFKVLSRGELRRELESFNNCYFTHIDGMWMYFRATPFAVRGIANQLGRRVEGMLENEYRILVSNIQTNH
jgi:hypothetical protein